MTEAAEEGTEAAQEDVATPKGLGVLDAPRDPLPLETLLPSEPPRKKKQGRCSELGNQMHYPTHDIYEYLACLVRNQMV